MLHKQCVVSSVCVFCPTPLLWLVIFLILLALTIIFFFTILPSFEIKRIELFLEWNVNAVGNIYLSFIFFIFYFFVFCFFRATPSAYGGFQARGLIRAVAASQRQSHSNWGSEPRLRPTPQLMGTRILNPLSKARNQTINLMVPSRIRFCCTTTGTPHIFPLDIGFL